MVLSITIQDMESTDKYIFSINDIKIIELINLSDDKLLFLKSSIELGCYIQSLCQPTRNGFQITDQINEKLQSTLSDIKDVFEPLKTNGTSVKIGRLGELLAENHVRKSLPEYTYEDVALTDKSGDAIMNTELGKIMIEYKHYGSSVGFQQIEKLKRDMDTQNISYAILMSYKSPISGKKSFDFEMFDGNKIIVYIHTAGYDGHCLILSIRFLFHLIRLDIMKTQHQIYDIIKQSHIQTFIDFYEKLLILSKKMSQLQNSIIESKQSVNNVFDMLTKQIVDIVCNTNILLENIKEYSDEVYQPQLSNVNSYQDLVEFIETTIDKNSDIILCKRLLSLCQSFSIGGYILDKTIHFHKESVSIAKLIILKSRCDIIFFNHKLESITINPMYELYKHNQLHITLNNNDEIWKIVEYRIKNLIIV